jgi:hypothetical protein
MLAITAKRITKKQYNRLEKQAIKEIEEQINSYALMGYSHIIRSILEGIKLKVVNHFKDLGYTISDSSFGDIKISWE